MTAVKNFERVTEKVNIVCATKTTIITILVLHVVTFNKFVVKKNNYIYCGGVQYNDSVPYGQYIVVLSSSTAVSTSPTASAAVLD